MTSDDRYRLQRFIDAQDQDNTYECALTELHAGRKRTHWMWFVFPQIAGFRFSDMSRKYAISSGDEASAYLAHHILGPRLNLATTTLVGRWPDAHRVLGAVDAAKLHGCMTLFAHVAPDEPLFVVALDRYFEGVSEQVTHRILTCA